MRPVGIHNKFAPNKADVPDRTMIVDAESNLGPKPTITLDGDSYAIQFQDATRETVKDRLFDFLYAVKKEHRKELELYGIHVYKTKDEINTELATGGLTLRTDNGYVSVRPDIETPKEDDIFRVLAHAIMQLSIQELLEEHQVTIINRR